MNYEAVKLVAGSPEFSNAVIIAVLALVCLLTASRKAGPAALLEPDQTGQAKGLAILLVVVGHLWVHAAHPKPWFIASGDGVAVFLLLSGFGLTASYLRNATSLGVFIKKRVSKVMVPYWVATVLFLVLDYALLGRAYSLPEIALTMAGINIGPTLQAIDYVRWYITFLLFWYACFIALMKWATPPRAAGLLFACGAGALLVSYYGLDLGWYQYFAFPVGVWLALNIDRLRSLAEGRAGLIAAGSAAALLVSLLVKWVLAGAYLAGLPSLAVCLVGEMNSLLFVLSLLGLIHWAGRRGGPSRFLLFGGAVSYELYLLHGPLLIKYDYLLPYAEQPGNAWSLPLFFLLLLAGLLALSWAMNKVLNRGAAN